MRKIVILLAVLMLSFPALSKDQQGKGHGAGGVRDEHASEMGMEKGKSWAGTKEKKAEGESEEQVTETEDTETKQKKEKEQKAKKEKKNK